MVYVATVTNDTIYGQLITRINMSYVRTFQNQTNVANIVDGHTVFLKKGDVLSVVGNGVKSYSFRVFK